MSAGVSSAGGAAEVPAATRGGRMDRVAEFLAREGLLVVVGGLFAISYLARFQMLGDSWYTLLSGGLVVHHGFPSHDVLAAWTAGRRWVDQQWLAQVVTYTVYRVGGFAAVALAYGTFAVGAYTGSMAAARVGGASARSIAWVAALAVVPFYIVASDPRAQTMAFALFVVLLVVLRSGRPLGARSVLLSLGTIAVWANVHGSVVVGAALVALRGAVEIFRGGNRRNRSALALVVFPWPLLFASPYGLSLVDYYRKILVGSGFSRLVVEWAPTSLKLETVPLYLLAFGAVWLLGATRRRLDSFDTIALVALLAMSLIAIRNMGWFALAAMTILPRALDEVRPEARSVGPGLMRFNALLAAGVLLLVVAVSSSALASVDQKVRKAYPAAAAKEVAAIARCMPGSQVFADVPYSDWLVWSQPGLRGRIAFDVRFELLRRSELESAQQLLLRVEGWKQLASRYGIFVLDPRTERDLERSLSTQLHFKPVYRGSTIVVLARGFPAQCAV